MKENSNTKPIRISCFDTIFPFDPHTDSPAWYDLDHAVSEVDGATLEINADRDVYAIYTAPDGTKHYGTIGDQEDQVLADNYPCDFDELYRFYENPRTKDYYV